MGRPAFLAFSAAVPILACHAPAEAQQTYVFDIAAQPLEAALVEFAAQARLALSLPPEGLGRRNSPALKGAYARDEALRILLTGSDYTFVSVTTSAYRIVPERVSRSAPLAPEPPGNTPADVIIISARMPMVEADLPPDQNAEAGA